jgi:DNA-binding transcriptional MerR regulator
MAHFYHPAIAVAASAACSAHAAGALQRLVFIRAAQAVGLSLAEIREVIAIRNGGPAGICRVIPSQLAGTPTRHPGGGGRSRKGRLTRHVADRPAERDAGRPPT